MPTIRLRAAFAATIGLALMATAGAGSVDAATSEAAREHPDDPSIARLLVEDDIYRREGAVTSLATCLAVADDPAADATFRRRFGPAGGEIDPARLLEAAAPGLAQEPGFGTLLACARIVASWHGHLERSDDGRLEHGAVVLDFALERGGGDAVVDPLPLVRLLTSPHLLPPSAFGGIVVRNARIAGTLLLYNLHLTMPLVFVDVTFAGGDYAKGVFGEADITGSAIAIRNSRFADHVRISESRICGKISIFDSLFEETLQLNDVDQVSACGEVDRAPGITVQSTRFQQSLTIYGSDFGEAHLVSNDIGSFLMSRNHFAESFSFEENDVGSFEAYGHGLSPVVEIRYNRIANDFFFEGMLPDDAPSDAIERLSIVSNRIGGGLGLRDFAASALPRTLDLRSNHVGNGSEICLPAAWRGSVDLDGSTYSGTLTVGLGFEPGIGGLDDEPRDPPCEGPYFVDQGRTLDTFCPPINDDPALRGAVVLTFTATSVRTLQWHLPLHCSYRWSGFGLTYDLWTPAGRAHAVFASAGEKWREAAFNAWRTSLRTYEPASLDQMSRYFVDKGAYVASRHLQYEAKRLNYGPECPPHQTVPGCIVRVLDLPGPMALLTGTAQADTAVERNAYEPFWRRAGRAVTLALLWPGGYGAQPERAIFLLAAFAFVFGAVYWVYVWAMRGRYCRFVARFEALPDLVPVEHPRHAELAAVVAQFRALRLERSHNRVLEVARDELEPRLVALQPFISGLDKAQAELRRLARHLGRTKVPGFSQFNAGQQPSRFTPLRYSIDTMLPVIDLHAYSNYYPEWTWMRGVTVVQHILGWWWLTVFIASAAIL